MDARPLRPRLLFFCLPETALPRLSSTMGMKSMFSVSSYSTPVFRTPRRTEKSAFALSRVTLVAFGGTETNTPTAVHFPGRELLGPKILVHLAPNANVICRKEYVRIPSVSVPCKQLSTANFWPANGSRRFTICDLCQLRSVIRGSSLTNSVSSVARVSASSSACFLNRAASFSFTAARSCAWLAVISATESTLDSCDCNLASAFEDSPSYTTSPTTPPTTNSRPIAAIGIPQLLGFSFSSNPLRALNHFRRDTAVSQISSKHPNATMPPEMSKSLNHFALSAASFNRTGSVDASLMNKRAKEMTWFLIYLACCGGIAICEVVYLFISDSRNKKAN